MIPKKRIILVIVCILALLLTAPSSATPIPIIIHGSVVELNETGHTMTLSPECQKYSCEYDVKGRLIGFVPDDAVFSRLKKGEVVEVVFKQWINQITDPGTGLLSPSDDIRDIHQWYSIQRLAYSDDGKTLNGTEIFGDPAYLETPLVDGYQIDYGLFGPNPRSYDYGIFPPETIANLSIKKARGFTRSEIIGTGETRQYTDVTDNTTINIQFLGGYNADFMTPKACPCANFHISVDAGEEFTPLVTPEKTGTASPNKSPVDPVFGIVTLGILAICSGKMKKR
jgi:hypothetical protein